MAVPEIKETRKHQSPEIIRAKSFDSGFPLSHDTYNGISVASDGRIYYILCSVDVDEGGKMYCFDPETEKIKYCGDLTEMCGEKNTKSIPQGKSHVPFTEYGKKLYFSTHIGYYTNIEGMDKMGIPPVGYLPYPGGHLLVYDMETGGVEDLAKVPHKEGVLTMSMDTERMIIYGITWPSGYFFRFDLKKNEMKDFGLISLEGENGQGQTFRTLCRCIPINPENGDAWFSTSEGDIYKCTPGGTELILLTEDNLRKDYFGQYDPASPGHMGYNWRQVAWHNTSKCFYGIHGNSGYLFKFDPEKKSIELVERLTSRPSKRSGMFDQFSYGYLGFYLDNERETIYYLTGAPIYKNGRRVAGKANTAKGEAKGLEDLHLVTFNITRNEYKDHGAIKLENGESPLYVNSIAVGKSGYIYFMGRIMENNTIRRDLIRIPDPLFKPE